MYAKCFKRVLDFVLSLCALIVLSPVLLILTVLGAIKMKGNPFFVQVRPGKIDRKTGKEKIFKMIKFRTMSNAKDKNGKLLSDSIRLNAYGKFLRSTSLDELPELLNILIGDMSIIGPRPLMARYIPYYAPRERCRHLVRPGLTGYAQVKGRNSLTWDERFALDVHYVEHISLKLDVQVFFDTVKTVLKREGIELSDLGNLDDYRTAYPEGTWESIYFFEEFTK